jgi:DNA ligase-1
VWSGEELVNVGKAYSGLTDAEIDALSRTFEKSTLERFGGVRLVRPDVVLEVGFDGIQRSKRHKSGFALRFPRILRIRTDKKAAEADSLAAVEALYASQLESGHREDAAVPAEAAAPARSARGRRTAKSKAGADAAGAQLDLFGQPRRP